MAKEPKAGRLQQMLTLRIEDDLREAIETAATVERRPVANLLRLVLRERFCARPDQPQRAASA